MYPPDASQRLRTPMGPGEATAIRMSPQHEVASILVWPDGGADPHIYWRSNTIGPYTTVPLHYAGEPS